MADIETQKYFSKHIRADASEQFNAFPVRFAKVQSNVRILTQLTAMKKKTSGNKFTTEIHFPCSKSHKLVLGLFHLHRQADQLRNCLSIALGEVILNSFRATFIYHLSTVQ